MLINQLVTSYRSRKRKEGGGAGGQYLYLWTDVGCCANPISILGVVIYSPVENSIRGIQKYQTAIRRALERN